MEELSRLSPLWGSKGRKPLARTAEVLVEEFGDELLVYDQRTTQVHCLSAPAQKVWRACHGSTSVEQLGPELGLEAEVVGRALEELEACGLLEGGTAAGVTRREAAARLAGIGAAAAGAPLIYSIAAPTPALAASESTCEALPCGSSSAFCITQGCVLCGIKSCEGGSTSGTYCVASCSLTNCANAKANAKCGKKNCVCDTSNGCGPICTNT